MDIKQECTIHTNTKTPNNSSSKYMAGD